LAKTQHRKNQRTVVREPLALQQAKNLLTHAVRNWNPLHHKTYIQVAQLAAAVLVGIGAYFFAKVISLAHDLFMMGFEKYPYALCAGPPLIFLFATWIVVRFAPEAKGSGIPQVLLAIDAATPQKPQTLSSPLVSLKTALVKVLSTSIGILGGASVGREGPTVQIASSLFAWVARQSRRFLGLVEFRSFLVAGAAAGIAAAFNTPLAGITFALEEIAESSFGHFKRAVMLSVIVGGITAQALGGNYLYFGHPWIPTPSASIIYITLVIGIAGGVFGGLFSRILTQPLSRILPPSWWQRTLVCGAVCAVFIYLSKGDTAGSGYEVTRKFMDNPTGSLPGLFFPEKFIATIFSYLSGMGGGIFSPSLSIGAGMGLDLAQLFHLMDLKACALIGMVAFFSGVVQAPLTAVVIIMEMTDQSGLLIPFLAAAFIAHGIGKLFMPVPLYRCLAWLDKKKTLEKPGKVQ
jgi:H+/Cl- antiporter ClcA